MFQCFHFYQQNSGQWTSATQKVTYENVSLMPGTTAQSESSPISHSGFAYDLPYGFPWKIMPALVVDLGVSDQPVYFEALSGLFSEQLLRSCYLMRISTGIVNIHEGICPPVGFVLCHLWLLGLLLDRTTWIGSLLLTMPWPSWGHQIHAVPMFTFKEASDRSQMQNNQILPLRWSQNAPHVFSFFPPTSKRYDYHGLKRIC